MAKSKRKLDSKAYAQQKRHRRQWVTFLRMLRYGVNNFSRNAWLTVAATAVMTITLFVIFASVASRQVLADTVSSLRESVSMSIYVETDTSDEAVETILEDLKNTPSVVSVSYITPEQARERFVEDNRNSPETLDAVREAENNFPGTFTIQIEDINDTTALQDFVANNATLKENIDENREPSFAGQRRDAIESIGRAANFAQQVGIGASIVFVIISMLIIFNTIRMAIFNRKEEIQMMKLIGAERSFIRGPFLVEAIVYGFFAALVASALGYALIFLAAPALDSYDINVGPTQEILTLYAAFVLLGMILIGAIIGVISSLMATRRYLKL